MIPLSEILNDHTDLSLCLIDEGGTTEIKQLQSRWYGAAVVFSSKMPLDLTRWEEERRWSGERNHFSLETALRQTREVTKICKAAQKIIEGGRGKWRCDEDRRVPLEYGVAIQGERPKTFYYISSHLTDKISTEEFFSKYIERLKGSNKAQPANDH